MLAECATWITVVVGAFAIAWSSVVLSMLAHEIGHALVLRSIVGAPGVRVVVIVTGRGGTFRWWSAGRWHVAWIGPVWYPGRGLRAYTEATDGSAWGTALPLLGRRGQFAAMAAAGPAINALLLSVGLAACVASARAAHGSGQVAVAGAAAILAAENARLLWRSLRPRGVGGDTTDGMHLLHLWRDTHPARSVSE